MTANIHCFFSFGSPLALPPILICFGLFSRVLLERIVSLIVFYTKGSWSWAWMEPLIGQASFMLLTMQFARSQLTNMGLKPYSNWMRHRRANRLVARFKQYDPGLLKQFSEVDKYYNGWNSDK